MDFISKIFTENPLLIISIAIIVVLFLIKEIKKVKKSILLKLIFTVKN